MIANARIVRALIRPAGRQVTIRDHDAARIDIANTGPASFSRANTAASGRGASGFASRINARRSVYFHSSTRRCGRPVAANCSNAAARSGAGPGRLRLRLLPFGRELLLGGVLDESDFSHAYSAATGVSWNCA